MVRDKHLTDPETSRDLFGVVRGGCSCGSCGRYIIFTAKYRGSSTSSTHPDCNLSLLDCSRCSCPAEAHSVDVAATARERGNDAMSLGEYDSAIAFYTEAVTHDARDWRTWSNRSLCYKRKAWYAQAALDADKEVALDPEYFKTHFRRGKAVVGLGRYEEAEAASRGRSTPRVPLRGRGRRRWVFF